MPGLIVGAYGYQRSGKTLIAFLLAEKYYKLGIPVYTNMLVDGYIHIEKLDDIPVNNTPKVLLLDEVQYFLDSRTWNDNQESSIFFNSIGKMNVLLLLTTIHPEMVEKRLRQQHNYVILVKSDPNFIYYRIKDNVRGTYKDFTLKKGPELFCQVRYDTNQVPSYVHCNLKKFNEKVRQFNIQQQQKRLSERSVL